MVNEEKDYEREFPQGYINAHGGGRRMLRIAAAAREHAGNGAVGAAVQRTRPRSSTTAGGRLRSGTPTTA